jgi:hypothetical protein
MTPSNIGSVSSPTASVKKLDIFSLYKYSKLKRTHVPRLIYYYYIFPTKKAWVGGCRYAGWPWLLLVYLLPLAIILLTIIRSLRM